MAKKPPRPPSRRSRSATAWPGRRRCPPVPARSARTARPAAADLHAGSVGVGSPGRRRRRCTCRTRSSSRDRSARSSRSDARACRRRSRPAPLDLDDPMLLLSSGLTPTPSNGRFHLQMVYAVCSLTYAAFRRALGRDIALGDGRAAKTARCGWSCGRSAFAAATPATAARRATCRSATSTRARSRRGSRCTEGLDLHGAQPRHHRARDDARAARRAAIGRSRCRPTSTCRPSTKGSPISSRCSCTSPTPKSSSRRFATARGQRVALLAAHRSRARVRLRAIASPARSRRSGRASTSTALPRSTRTSCRGAKGGPICYDPTIEPHLLGSVLVSAVFEAFMTIVRRKTERFFRHRGRRPACRSAARR